MKLRITIGFIALAAMFAVLFSACESEIIDTSTPQAELLSLKIRNTDIVVNRIPVPVNNREWEDEGFGEDDMYDADFSTISFKRDDDLVDTEFELTVSRGAKVKYGVANRTVRPNKFEDTRVPATFDAQDFIYFQVISEDNERTNYYRFSTYMSSPVKELSKIEIAGREADLASPDTVWNGDRIRAGTLYITRADAAGAVINATPWDERAKLRYAKTPYAASRPNRVEPVFEANNTLTFQDSEFLYVEVQAENTLDVNIYLFTVYVGRIATIKSLTFKSPAKGDFEALGKGTAKNSWTDNSGAGSFNSPHQPDNGFTVAVELDEVQGRWQYAKTTSTSIPGSEPSWLDPPTNGEPAVKFSNGEYLLIKVIPPNRLASAPDFFYKVKVGLLAAEFTKQPKPNYYEKGATAELLDFALDREVEGATYQWYEANSWYGGYGFDSMGRIGKSKAAEAEADWGKDDKSDLDPENPLYYDVSEWYKRDYDEKENVSLHNGGNNWYRLPIPGKPIPGATGLTYRPETNFRPFLSNFSNESHYYWVVVTDKNGLKATSERAVIVTEWGVLYKDGKEVLDKDGNPTKVDKEHYIIDLHAYETNGYGLQEPPRNAIPFKVGNHGSEYVIPVTFPPDFDIMDYSVFTAQALFFLADGREWIQNWTQGDIGFWAIPAEEANNPGAQPREVVLWYNLTNDNATRGLGSSGNEPSGSSLDVRPTHIVIKPAGTKDVNLMPPFEDGLDGRPGPTYDSVGRIVPYNNDNAQGWFTPYIELSELRFEGPSRKK